MPGTLIDRLIELVDQALLEERRREEEAKQNPDIEEDLEVSNRRA